MRRRTNKSSKVPNVKLRPAPAHSLARDRSEQLLVADSQFGSEDTAIVDFCPRPFKNLIICATGIGDKPSLFRKAAELGATHVSAFTDKVTHLIAEDHGGPKYMCALERKIPIMKPSWVTDNYDIWLRGDDVDFEESMAAHCLPIFSGIMLCLSGITDMERRVKINKLVTKHGGVYVKNLERPVKVTHLLCSGDEETDKMRYAVKFNKRKEAVIHLIWEDWFWDCVEFGGRFDESRYEVDRPRPERKSLREVPTSPPQSEPPSEMNEASSPQPQQQTSSLDDDEEVASVKVLPAVTLQIWGSLLNRRGYQVSGTDLVRTASAPAVFQKRAEPPDEELGKSVISAFKRTKSFAPTLHEENEGAAGRTQPFRRATTTAVPNGESSASAEEPVAGPSKTSMFAGYKFSALGEAKSQNVKNAVESYGGQMVSELDEEVDFIIVRLVSGSKLYREEMDASARLKYRTECWLERCIFEDQLLPPDKDSSFIPLAIDVPISGANKIILSLSGFDQSESCGLRRLLRALGMTLAPNFSKRTTHLLCPSGTGPKFVKACEWGKPVVKMSWLSVIVSTGIIPPIEGYLVPGDVGVPMEVEGKGKGKAKAVPQDLPSIEIGNAISDITNTDNSGSSVNPHHNADLSHQSAKVTPSSSSSLSFGQAKYGLQAQSLPLSKSSSIASVPPQSGSLSPKPAQSIKHLGVSRGSSTQSDNSVEVGKGKVPTPTWQEIEQERLTAKIPSSRTPSPMKLSRQGSRTSVSPTKIDPEATKALQESITRALKRHTSEEDDVLNGGRNAKRQRPQRRKALKQASQQQISEISSDMNPMGLIPLAASSISPFESFELDELDSLPVVEPVGAAGSSCLKGAARNRTSARRTTRSSVVGDNNREVDGGDSSMRVMYEDPSVAEERRKLMKLLKNGEQESPSQLKEAQVEEPLKRGRRTRKSLRAQ
ncbi:hypothetical protein AGABI2DRAFT_183783, partial [Agaricus bisporus var. bisporus H97]|uniref:hypothetical protein n=1 Tax=Agaricus bisporus var. bisporus (strain H97 / ATCC MYA-4626 / FGSC 10389) TaxID=936046 RepID=UPI00029F517B